MEKLLLTEALLHNYEIMDKFSSERSMQLKLKQLIEQNRIAKIKNGLYATINPLTGDIFANKFEIASALFNNACIAYHSALEFYGLTNQMFSEVQVITENRNIPFYYDGLEYRFYLSEIKDGLTLVRNNSEIRVTNLERTIIDCIDRIDLAGGIEELTTALEYIDHIDENLLIRYLKAYNKKVLFKKVGFLLSQFLPDILSEEFFNYCKDNVSSRIDSICENNRALSKSNKDWDIVYPANMMYMEG